MQAQAARYADTAALFQALGGGWWNRIDVLPNPHSPEDADAVDHNRSGRRRASDSNGAQAMTKRMVIMLVAVAVVFGGIFGFQAFKAAMIKKFMSAMSVAAADRLGDQGRATANGSRTSRRSAACAR